MNVQRYEGDAEQVCRILDVAPAPPALELLRIILSPRVRLRTVNDLSSMLRVHRRTIARRLQNAGLPDPNAWIQLGKVLWIRHALLQDEKLTHAEACRQVGNIDPYTASNLVKRITGRRPHCLRSLTLSDVVQAWSAREMVA